MGGDYGSTSYGAQGSNLNFAIMGGKLFANIPNTTPFGQSLGRFECIDLATGKVLYTANGTITAGLHLPGDAYSQARLDPSVLLESSFGSDRIPYLYSSVGSTWNYYDPLTGTLLQSLTNAMPARLIDGTMLAYGVTSSGNLFRWNMTKVLWPTGFSGIGTMGNNWTKGIEWTKPLAISLNNTYPALFAISTDGSTLVLRVPNQYWAYSAKDGTSLWNLTLDYPTTQNQAFTTARGVDDIITLDTTESTFKSYSMLTGALLWTSTSFSDSVWATTWTVYWSETNDNENLYVIFPDGTMRAYSLQDGHEVWRSKAISSTEYPNNAVPTVNSVIMVDGKLYGFAGYSSQYKINPISRQAMIVAINATNGDTIFTLNGGLRSSATANGYVIATGDYDGNLYCLGKGQTSTTVTAQQQVGGSVLIQGSVLDTSEVSSSEDLTARFANGVPAISDADMSVWMDYLHMQNATLLNNPPICTGVPVTLTAVDPNGNVNVIGTATSDYQGNYGFQWTPTTQGLYTVYATFTGSNSYYTSSASTYATVSMASTPIPTPTSGTEATISSSDMLSYFAITAIAIIIAIAVATVLILRKK
jgi:hypothetical protein